MDCVTLVTEKVNAKCCFWPSDKHEQDWHNLKPCCYCEWGANLQFLVCPPYWEMSKSFTQLLCLRHWSLFRCLVIFTEHACCLKPVLSVSYEHVCYQILEAMPPISDSLQNTVQLALWSLIRVPNYLVYNWQQGNTMMRLGVYICYSTMPQIPYMGSRTVRVT